MKRIRKNNTRLDLIMPKYCLFVQRRERIKRLRIAKRNLDLIIHDPRSTGNNYFRI